MKLLSFECKKMFRSPGFRYLCAATLILNFLFCLFGNIYSPSEEEKAEHIANYDSNIEYVKRVAERNREEYEAVIGDDNYLVRYQDDIIVRYGRLLQSQVRPAEIHGWDEFFDNRFDDVLLLLLSVFVSVIMTMTEHDNGTCSILNMCVNGRKNVLCKIVLFAVLSFSSVLLMNITCIAGVALRFGLSSPTVPLCSVIHFLYCPGDISIFSYLFLSLFIKTINSFVMMLFSALVAGLFKSYLVSFFFSFSLIIVGYGISSIQSSSGWIYINPYTIGITDPMWERYRSVNLLERSVPLIAVSLAVLFFSCISFAVLCRFTLLKGTGSLLFNRIERSVSKAYYQIKEKLLSFLPHPVPRRHGLLYTEAKKVFIKSRLFILCVIMVFVKVSYSDAAMPEGDAGEQYYRDVCYGMRGLLTDEKRQLISDKLEKSNIVISRMDSMRNALQNGMITGEEYGAYLDEYGAASLDEFAYGKLAEQCIRVDAAKERGQTAYLIYDSGWIHLLSQKADIILYSFLLLFFCGIYEMEYKNGFDCVAKTTMMGMGALHKSKIVFTVIAALLSFTVFYGIDFIYILESFTLPNANFQLASVMMTSISVPLWSAALLKIIFEAVSAVSFSVIVCLFSRFIKKVYLVIPAGMLVVWMLFSVVD